MHGWWKLEKRLTISAAHFLNLPYDSQCKNMHGHNWLVVITLECSKLNESGMVVDFTRLKKLGEEFDHQLINALPGFKGGDENPTAERLAQNLAQRCRNFLRPEVRIVEVRVQETEGNVVSFQPEEV